MPWIYGEGTGWYKRYSVTPIKPDTREEENLIGLWKFVWPEWAVKRVNEMIKKGTEEKEAKRIVDEQLGEMKRFYRASAC